MQEVWGSGGVQRSSGAVGWGCVGCKVSGVCMEGGLYGGGLYGGVNTVCQCGVIRSCTVLPKCPSCPTEAISTRPSCPQCAAVASGDVPSAL